ncbi:MAG: hypothetical protein V4448_06880 [Pseudomonadota bacterium]
MSSYGHRCEVAGSTDQLIELDKPYAIVGHRSILEQIEFWARLGKAAEAELPNFIKNILLAFAEADTCQPKAHSQRKNDWPFETNRPRKGIDLALASYKA